MPFWRTARPPTTRSRDSQEAWDRVLDWLGARLDDVVNVEVNTIIAHGGMTGRKMPPTYEALFELSKTYGFWLQERLVREGMEIYPAEPPPRAALVTEIPPERHFELDRAALVPRRFEIEAGAFLLTRVEAARLRTRYYQEDRRNDPELAILLRVQRHSEILDGMLQTLLAQTFGPELAEERATARAAIEDGVAPADRALRTLSADSRRFGDEEAPPDLDDVRETAALRKIWELSVNQVMIQTVMQLDGDMVVRIAPALIGDRRETMLRDVHERASRQGLEYWRVVLTLLRDISGGRR